MTQERLHSNTDTVFSHHWIERLFYLLTICLFATSSLHAAPTIPLPRASITAADMGIIIVDGDATSEAIGAYYQAARGIPAANVVRVKWPAGYATGADNVSADAFQLIKTQVDATLPSNVQATLLTWTRPFRVQGNCAMSITSAFALGFNIKYCGNGSEITTEIPYFDSDSITPWQSFGIRPSMMLGASTIESAKVLINRGVSADNTYPLGDGYLIRTTDSNRSNPRFSDFQATATLWNYPEGLQLNYINNQFNATGSDYIQGKDSVLFYFTGLTTVPNLTTNTFLPGAIGDHLTSFGGIISGSGQMPSTKWLEAGATASYGTVVEPYAYQDKFPKASVVIDQYYRGATLIEAYWKSVRRPGQGLFLGEPLARPYADNPSSEVELDHYVLNTRTLRRDSQYILEYKTSSESTWLSGSVIYSEFPQQRKYQLPIISSAKELRLTGPCSEGTSVVDIYPMINDEGVAVELGSGGRAQRIYFQGYIYNSDQKTSSTCNASVSLSVDNLPSGITGSVIPARLILKPQEYAFIKIAIDIPADLAQIAEYKQDFQVSMVDSHTAKRKTAPDLYTINLAAATDTQLPLMRIRQPSTNWALADYPERTSHYEFPVEVDVLPSSGIRSIVYELKAVELWSGANVQGYTFKTVGVSEGLANNFAAKLKPARLSSGLYSLQAVAQDASGSTIFTDSKQVYVEAEVNTINGTPGRDTIIGSEANDIITGGSGGDNITGGEGVDIFVYNSLRDAGDTIQDFKVGVDRVDLSLLLVSLGFNKPNALANKVVSLVNSASGAVLRIDADGDAGPGVPRPLLIFKGVGAETINPDRDLQLAPRTHIFAPH